MRLERESPPDPMDRRSRHARGFGHGACAPVCRIVRHHLQGARHHLADLLVTDLAWSPGPGLIAKAVEALAGKALAPGCCCQARDPQPVCNGEVGQAIGGQKHDLSSYGIGPRDLAPACPPLQFATFIIAQYDPDRCTPSHDHLPHTLSDKGIITPCTWL